MIGRHAHALFRHGTVLAKVGLALIEEEHRVGRAVEVGKIPLLVLRVEVQLAWYFGTAAVAALGRGGLLLHGGHVGLQGGDLGREVLQLLEEVGEGRLGHGGCGGCGSSRWRRLEVGVSGRGCGRWMRGSADL
jgi:hypothetical protein